MWLPSEPGRVLGIDFGGTKVAVSTGNAQDVRTYVFAPGTPAAEVLDYTKDLIFDMGVRDPVVISISTPGVITGNRALFAPNVNGWEQVDFIEWANQFFPSSQVLLTNDVEAAGWGELLAGHLQGTRNGLYVNLGTGIAAAAVVGGCVVHGACGMAGEIGYARVGPASDIAWNNDEAELEQFSGGVGLSRIGAKVPVDQEAEWLASINGIAARERLDEFARHLLTCALLLDPERIVVGGGLGGVPLVAEHISRRINSVTLRPIPVAVSRFGANASVVGALTLGTRVSRSKIHQRAEAGL